MRPTLGLLLFADYSLEELVRLGRVAEELGYHSLWYTDIRFGRECYVSLAAVAAVTSKLLLGPGVSDPYSRHPAVTAATIATFDDCFLLGATSSLSFTSTFLCNTSDSRG